MGIVVVAQLGPELIPIAIGLGAVGGLGAIGAGVAAFRHRRRVGAARRDVDQIRATVRQAYVSADERWGVLLNDVVVTRGRLADDDGFALQIEDQRQQATDALQASTSAYVQAEADHDPDIRTTTEDLATAREWWTRVDALVADATAHVEALANLVADVDRTEDRCAAILDGIGARLAAAQTAVQQAAGDGYRVADLEEALARSQDDQRAGATALRVARLWDAAATLGRADDTISRVQATATGLAHRRGDLLARHATFTSRADAAGAMVSRIADLVGAMRQEFAASVWESADGAPAQAAAALGDARRRLDDVVEAASMQQQRFDDADHALAEAISHLQLLDRIDAGVAEVRQDVDKAVAEYPAAHTEAARSLEEARRFTAEFAGDVNPAHQPSLDRAARLLAEAESMAASRRADPFIAVQRLREVDSMTDAILYTARTEKQQIDAYRARAVALIRDAGRSVRRAHSASGFGVFGWSARAKQQLLAADQALAEANAIYLRDPGRAEYLAVEADQIAHQILAEHRRRQRNQGPHISF